MNLKKIDIAVPQEYENPSYVLKNAETIISNKWTVIVQETLWAQRNSIEKIAGTNPNARQAVTALDAMNKQSRKKDGGWDRKFTKGGATDKALQAVRKVAYSGYKPIKVSWKSFFKKDIT